MSARKEVRDLRFFRRKADMENAPTLALDMFRRQVELRNNPRKPMPEQFAHREPSKSEVRRWMRANASEYDGATELAEACNAVFDLPASWLDDPDHWVWEVAASQQHAQSDVVLEMPDFLRRGA